MPYQYDYARPALTVDIVVFALDADELKVMLIERGGAPFVGHWALPGGFVEVDETLDTAARRELEEETGLSGFYLEQLYTFGAVDRDPRERVITVAYFALVNLREHTAQASSDAARAEWFAISKTPALAFDHQEILNTALERLRAKVRYQPVGFELLPKVFPLRELQHLYELVLDRQLDKRNFRKKILSMDILIETDDMEQDVPHRAARLYRFDKVKYERLSRQGFNFEI